MLPADRMPMQERPEPLRVNPLIDKLLPNFTKLSTESDPPLRAKLLILIELPKFAYLSTLRLPPSLA
jgi:hypothetical protein